MRLIATVITGSVLMLLHKYVMPIPNYGYIMMIAVAYVAVNESKRIGFLGAMVAASFVYLIAAFKIGSPLLIEDPDALVRAITAFVAYPILAWVISSKEEKRKISAHKELGTLVGYIINRAEQDVKSKEMSPYLIANR